MLDQIDILLRRLAAEIIQLLPRFILVLLVIFLGWLVALLLKKLTLKLILFLNGKLNSKLQSQLLSVDLQRTAQFCARAVFWIVILFSFALVTQILGLPLLPSWFNGLVSYIPNILAAIIIVFTGIIASGLAGDLVETAVKQADIASGKQLKLLVRFIIMFIASVIAINQIGIDIKFLTNLVTIIITALLFGATLSFALGAKTSVSNILGSYYVQKTYHEGDMVRIGDIEGEIVKITPTAVYLKTKSGQATIPAKKFNEEKSVLLIER